jgi:hypothetical protein
VTCWIFLLFFFFIGVVVFYFCPLKTTSSLFFVVERTGEKFIYLKNEAALLELALVNWVMHKLVMKGYRPVVTPDLVRPVVAEGCGYQPRGEARYLQVFSNVQTPIAKLKHLLQSNLQD